MPLLWKQALEDPPGRFLSLHSLVNIHNVFPSGGQDDKKGLKVFHLLHNDIFFQIGSEAGYPRSFLLLHVCTESALNNMQ